MIVKTSTIGLVVLSFSLVFYAEWIYPSNAFKECKWPLGDTAKHIALIADPQIIDAHTYPTRNSVAQWISRIVADRYMARNFRLMNRHLRPDSIYFLGDLFDGGREWQDGPWKEELARWNQIFPRTSSPEQFLNLPGNHDVGSRNDIIQSAYSRFSTEFGNPNQIRRIGGHEIVTLDTNALMADKIGNIREPTVNFLNEIKENREKYGPIIVLSHVPFYRPDGSYCGFEREAKPFKYTQGVQYVTEVTPELTDEIIQALRPVFIFSGDDHDACTFKHNEESEFQTIEHNVKSFSLAMGIKRPGFQLLSLDTRNRHETDSCILAKPFYPILFQAVAFVALIVVIWIHSWVTERYSTYERSDDPEKGKHIRYRKLLKKGAIYKSLVVGGSWCVGQLLINWWSYSPQL